MTSKYFDWCAKSLNLKLLCDIMNSDSNLIVVPAVSRIECDAGEVKCCRWVRLFTLILNNLTNQTSTVQRLFQCLKENNARLEFEEWERVIC